MSRWEEVLDVQLDLSRSLGDPNNLTHQHVVAYSESLTKDPSTTRGWPTSLSRDLPNRLSAMIFNADPVYVEPDMQTVWDASVEGFRPEPLQPTDLITPAGFLLLPKGVWGPDINGLSMSWRALMWHPLRTIYLAKKGAMKDADVPGKDGWDTFPVVRSTDGDDDTYTAQGILVSLWHHTDDHDDQTARERAAFPNLRLPRGLYLTHVMPWHYGESWGGSDVDHPGSAVRPLQSLWRLMLQTIGETESRRAGGPFRRRWEKAKWPEKRVTIVRLRRPRHDTPDDDGDPATVAWTRRWIVGGHWRNQWYPSLGIHRQIWISPYVKGPEDLPLVPSKARIFELVR